MLQAADLLDAGGAAMWAWWRIGLGAIVLMGIFGAATAPLGPGWLRDIFGVLVLSMWIVSGIALPEFVFLYYQLRSLMKQVTKRGDYLVDLRSPSRGVPHSYDFWIAAVAGLAAMALVNWSASG